MTTRRILIAAGSLLVGAVLLILYAVGSAANSRGDQW